MIGNTLGRRLGLSALAALLLFAAGPLQAAPKLKTLFAFEDDGKGKHPWSTLVFDDAGALYGTTYEGGAKNFGTVFQLLPPEKGKSTWKRKVLHEFVGGSDGAGPQAGLAIAPDGALYGTTDTGGKGKCSGGCGTVFELKPGRKSGWQYSVIHHFAAVPEGVRSSAQLVIDRKGRLYGTTRTGGTEDMGTVFRLKKASSEWAYTVLHSFRGGDDDGQYPVAGVVFGPDGALYGTTQTGGSDVGAKGVVYRLSQGGGSWNTQILHRFGGGTDGEGPIEPVAFDDDGALYGTTPYGGQGACFLFCGTVFRIGDAAGAAQYDVIYRFAHGTDGSFPRAGVTVGPAGIVYGTTSKGGDPASLGTVFQLKRKGGSWKEKVLFRFTGPDGAVPFAGVILDTKGHLFGTTRDGGQPDGEGYGSVYQLTP